LTIFEQRRVPGNAPRILQIINAVDRRPDLSETEGAAALLLDFGCCHGPAAVDARAKAREIVTGAGKLSLWIGLHRLDEEEEMALDIASAIDSGAEGVALRSARSGAELQHLHVLLEVAEAERAKGATRLGILAFAGDNPVGLLSAGSFAAKSNRLAAIGWHGGRLGRSLSAGVVGDPVAVAARGTIQLAAAAAGVAAIDWIDHSSTLNAAGHGAVASAGFDWVLREG
jgi:citrate lyase beta subunit